MNKFKRGQRVVCTHYKAKPIVTVDHWDSRNEELWVNEPKCKNKYWWGPLNWFKAIRPIRKPRVPKKHSGFLCEDNVVGCSRNQSASVAQ